jgi:hypothetical protein
MLETCAILTGTGASVVIIIGLFIRIEHRLTRLETLSTIIAVKVGICRPKSEDPIQ